MELHSSAVQPVKKPSDRLPRLPRTTLCGLRPLPAFILPSLILPHHRLPHHRHSHYRLPHHRHSHSLINMGDVSSGVHSNPCDALARRRQDQTLSRAVRAKRREQVTQLPNSKITKRTKHTKPQAGNTASPTATKLVLTVHHWKAARISPLTGPSKPRLPMSLFSLTSPSLSSQLHLPSLNSPLSSHPYENASSTPQPEHHTSSRSTKRLTPRQCPPRPRFSSQRGCTSSLQR